MDILYSDIIDDNFIENLLKNGFNCGEKYGSDETIFDMEALYRLFEDNNVKEEDQKTFLITWLPKRFNYVMNSLFPSITKENDYIHIYRKIFLNNDDIYDFLHGDEPLGDFWTSHNQYIEGWGDENNKHILIHGLIKKDDIDWKTSVIRNMNYLYGDDEQELTLFKDVPINIISIHIENKKIQKINPIRTAGNKDSSSAHMQYNHN